MAKDFSVTNQHPLRRLEWLEMFDATCLPVKSITPDFAMVVGFDEPQPVYYVDLELLTLQQRQRLVRHLAVKHGLSIEQVEHQLLNQDVPVLAAECTLMVKNPHKWLV